MKLFRKISMAVMFFLCYGGIVLTSAYAGPVVVARPVIVPRVTPVTSVRVVPTRVAPVTRVTTVPKTSVRITPSNTSTTVIPTWLFFWRDADDEEKKSK